MKDKKRKNNQISEVSNETFLFVSNYKTSKGFKKLSEALDDIIKKLSKSGSILNGNIKVSDLEMKGGFKK